MKQLLIIVMLFLCFVSKAQQAKSPDYMALLTNIIFAEKITQKIFEHIGDPAVFSLYQRDAQAAVSDARLGFTELRKNISKRLTTDETQSLSEIIAGMEHVVSIEQDVLIENVDRKAAAYFLMCTVNDIRLKRIIPKLLK